ncbi:MAG: helicase-associated domain-containing protein [Candidatus Nanopelagicales bacterium]
MRSLADDLRGRSDEDLARLLAGRPDLLHPVPADMTALAARAGAAISTSRALDRLDGLTLAVAHAVNVAAEPCALESVLESFPADRREQVERALGHLRAIALVWGPDDALRLVRTAKESLDSDTSRVVEWPPPALASIARDPGLVERTAGQHALATVVAVTTIAEAWSGDEAPPVLRKGGLGVRDLTATARLLDSDERGAALMIETAHAAGLIGRDEDNLWRPTADYDDWHDRPLPEQWVELARAWWTSTRAPSTVGVSANALSEDVEQRGQPLLREQVVAILGELSGGAAPADAHAVIGALHARAPRQSSPDRDAQVCAILEELEVLGFTGGGALSRMGARAAANAEDAVLLAAEAMPAPLDHVLLQADLTAVAPGPLIPDLARDLRLMADVESTGGAVVYRFTSDSVRRAMDAGRDAAGLHELLARISLTPVPQPLTYLIDDAARRHGTVRVGVATAYIRCDDESALAALLADPRSAALGCVRAAPTVVTVSGRIEDAIAILRDLGLHPVAETPDGQVALPPRRRARAPRNSSSPVVRRDAQPALITAAIATLRGAGASPRRVPSTDDSLPPMPVSDTLAVLRKAISSETPVRICYAGDEGVIDPLRLQAGVLTAVDRVTGEVRTFQVPLIQAADLAAHTP